MTEIEGEPINVEPEKHPQMIFAEILEHDNELGFAVKIEDTIIEDVEEIQLNLYDLYVYKYQVAEKIQKHVEGKTDVPVYALAWTTTPWTLPSNMFLAAGENIAYVQIFDLERKCYFVLARAALSRYYKNSDEYIIVNSFYGSGLKNIAYQPLFPYITNSSIKPEYKKQFFHIINAPFV